MANNKKHHIGCINGVNYIMRRARCEDEYCGYGLSGSRKMRWFLWTVDSEKRTSAGDLVRYFHGDFATKIEALNFIS